ncbi:MAG: ABC transporter ATP-binding protein [Proteobacteria bacterium]|nr:ABC transporter ATP-binding protein [Pseudomonadota bacterium]
MTLLSVENLSVTLNTMGGPARAVRDMTFTLERGETLGLVGESGCGKSMTALALMGLLPETARASGAVRLEGENLLEYSEAAMCRVRGNRIAMVFQEPMTSLNPLHTVGHQIGEALSLHRKLGRGEAQKEALRLLEVVGIPDAGKRLGNYPHQLSGGQRQRVMIAMALSCGPDLLIADEPTTALDVTIQKQILDLIRNLVNDLGMAMILISHDLGVIAQSVDRVHVMYGGGTVESGPTAAIFEHLSHPYTQGLFAAMPKLGQRAKRKDGAKRQRLNTIPGVVPELADLPAGCTFAERCGLVTDECRAAPPPLTSVAPPAGNASSGNASAGIAPARIVEDHFAACVHLDEARARLNSA